MTTVKKVGPGAFNIDSFQKAIDTGKEVGMEIHKVLLAKILKEERMGIGRKKVGFL